MKTSALGHVVQIFSVGDYFITFDVKLDYHHVDINEEFWQYLDFSVGVGSDHCYFMFKVLPFGLATVSY